MSPRQTELRVCAAMGVRGWPLRGHACTADGPAYAGTAVPVNANEGAYGVTIDRATFALEKQGTFFMTEESRRLAKKAARESRKKQKGATVAAETKTARTPPVKSKNMYVGKCDERVLAKGQQHDPDLMCPH